MKAKYNLEALHTDCLKWCEKPVFLPRQEGWSFAKDNHRNFIKDVEGNVMWSIYDNVNYQHAIHFVLMFAHCIGLNVESYRIKETFKSAVERFLEPIENDQPFWEGCLLFKIKSPNGTVFAFSDSNTHTCI